MFLNLRCLSVLMQQKSCHVLEMTLCLFLSCPALTSVTTTIVNIEVDEKKKGDNTKKETNDVKTLEKQTCTVHTSRNQQSTITAELTDNIKQLCTLHVYILYT